PVPAPEGLLANGFLPTPERTWGRARAAIGGPAAFFPQSFGGLVATALGLPITAASEIDGDVPALAAISAPPGGAGKARFVAGVHVKVGDRLLDQLTRGDAARFSSTTDGATHIALLTPKTGGKSTALGLLGNWLLVSSKKDDLLALGPYVARTMPSLQAPKEDVALDATDQAFGPAGLERLHNAWTAIKGQAQAGGAPVALAGRIDDLFAVLGDVSRARATLVFDEGVVHVRAALTPKPGGGAATKAAADMRVGDAKPMLDLPAVAQLAAFARVPASEGGATPAVDAVTALAGKDVPPADAEAITAAVRAARDAAGEYATLGVAITPTGPEGFARFPVVDQDKASKAFADVAGLLKLPSFKARLEASKFEVKTGKMVVENLPGDVQRVRFMRAGEGAPEKGTAKAGAAKAKAAADDKPGATPDHVDVLYLVEKDVAVAAVGADAKDALRAVAKTPADQTLGSDAKIRAAVEGLGSDVAFAVFLDPPRLVAARVGKPTPPSSTPVVLALGRDGAAASRELLVRLDLANAALQELIRSRSAF
ncbi:MAG TPA: hypothetical protein VHB21_18320, partial [Minicystis sp.]|nr:hypothetical protein [Minicystis sp.]